MSFGWSNLPTCRQGGRCVFGRESRAQRVFEIDVPHDEVIISVDFYFFDSWDNEQAQMTVDGEVVWSERNDQRTYDSLIEVQVPHTADTLTVEFTSTIDEDECNESWGLGSFFLLVVGRGQELPDLECPPGFEGMTCGVGYIEEMVDSGGDVPGGRRGRDTNMESAAGWLPDSTAYTPTCTEIAWPTRLETKRHEGDYTTNVDRCVLVRAPEGQRIRASFARFETEDAYDYLFLYDGDSERADLLGQIDCCPTVGAKNSPFLEFILTRVPSS
jgi:hypothetical protein|eukprot:COSAG06_NODE_141_length_22310_cov_9.973166_10_plen_272_part_00